MAGKTMDKATIAEASFIIICALKHWECAKPLHHANGYDFVIRRTSVHRWETVQVKAAYVGTIGKNKKPARVASMRRCNEKGARLYSEGDFDFLFVWDGEKDQWLIPWDAVKNVRSAITLMGVRGPTPKYAEYRF